jgi:truncated hemoglobin YjbI
MIMEDKLLEPFERWLKLFKEATDKYFVPELAEKFYKKADILAEQFIENLGIDDDDEDW